MKKTLRVTGYTVDGKPVMAGIFRIAETHGVPLDVILEQLHQENLCIDWRDYYLSALASGMTASKVLTQIEQACADVYGPEAAGAARTFAQRMGGGQVE